MDFTPTETQTAVRGVVSDVLDRDSGGWKALAGAGLLGVAVPSDHGGEGLGLPEVGVLLHEVGLRARALPVWETLACGALTLSACGTPDQQGDLLPDVVTGEALLTAALLEPGDGIPTRPRTTLRREHGRLVVTGRKLGVSRAEEARRVLVPVAGPRDDEVRVVLLDPRAEGVRLTPTRGSRGEPEATLELRDVEVSEADLLGGPGCGEAARTLRRNAVAGLCLLGAGLVAGARDLTAGYVGQRRQFGRALAEFQAVAQQVADVYISARTIGLTATSAAWRYAEGLDPDHDLAVAAYWFTIEGPAAMHTCHHLHGGTGVDVTYPLHTYSSWAKDVSRALGGPELALERLAAQTLDPAGRS